MLITILTPVLATLWGYWFNHEALSSHLNYWVDFSLLWFILYTYRKRHATKILKTDRSVKLIYQLVVSTDQLKYTHCVHIVTSKICSRMK
jgi:hypothetical protein